MLGAQPTRPRYPTRAPCPSIPDLRVLTRRQLGPARPAARDARAVLEARLARTGRGFAPRSPVDRGEHRADRARARRGIAQFGACGRVLEDSLRPPWNAGASPAAMA